MERRKNGIRVCNMWEKKATTYYRKRRSRLDEIHIIQQYNRKGSHI
jgi:hypothetical protein